MTVNGVSSYAQLLPHSTTGGIPADDQVTYPQLELSLAIMFSLDP